MNPAAPAGGGAGEPNKGVLLLPGILLPPLVNALLARDLRRRGFRPVLNWGYRGLHPPAVAELACRLQRRLERRFPQGAPVLHAVGHSMGGLVLRRLWANGALPGESRFVFLGVPHRGAAKAERFGNLRSFRFLFGAAGRDLRPGSAFLRDLPLPPAGRILNVLGGGPDGEGFSRLLPEDDDGTVEASSATLAGVREIRFAGVRHSCLPLHAGVRRVAAAFLARD